MLHAEDSANWNTCLDSCTYYASCNWFSFNLIGKFCLLFETCQNLDEDLSFVSGQKDCPGKTFTIFLEMNFKAFF